MWVVVSLIWVALVAAVSWPSVTNPYVEPHAFVEGAGDTAWSRSSQKVIAAEELHSRGRMVEVTVDDSPGITYFAFSGDDAKLEDAMERQAPLMIGFYQAQQSMKRKAALFHAAVIGLVPPFILLVVGVMVFWALNGFRSNAT